MNRIEVVTGENTQERFICEKEIGRGRYGTVRKARSVGSLVAVKFLEATEADGTTFNYAAAEREASLHKESADGNQRVIPFILYDRASSGLSLRGEHYIRRGTPLIAMDFAPHGSLSSRIKADGMPIDEAIQLTFEIAVGLQPLHSNGIVHCDVKPANILFDQSRLMLADFGAAQRIEENDIQKKIFIGTPSFSAPERFYGV